MAQPTTQLNATEQDTLVKQIGLALLRAAPRDWRRVTAEYRAVGRYHEMTGEIVTQDGTAQVWVATHDIATLFGRLRAGMYRDGRGTWFNAKYQLDHPSSYNLEYNRDEPDWHLAPPPLAYSDELRIFPRSEENVPEWVIRRMSGLAPEQPGPRFRIARIFETVGPAGRPVINRPDLEVEEQDRLLAYLDSAPLVVSDHGYDIDRLAQTPEATVPVAFHSDGLWIWPAAVNFYLREYGVSPEPDLVEHVRAVGFTLSEVDDQTLQAAGAHLQPPRPAGLPQVPPPASTSPLPPVPPASPPAALPPPVAVPLVVGGDALTVPGPGRNDALNNVEAPPVPPLEDRLDQTQFHDPIDFDEPYDEHFEEAWQLAESELAREAAETDQETHEDAVGAVPHGMGANGAEPGVEQATAFAPSPQLDPGPPTMVSPPIPPLSELVTSATPVSPMQPREPALLGLRAKLDELAIPENAYRIGEPAEHGWSLEQVETGWRVGWYDGELANPAAFGDVEDAAAFMLGKLLLAPGGQARPGSVPEKELDEEPAQSSVLAVLSPEVATGHGREEHPRETTKPTIRGVPDDIELDATRTMAPPYVRPTQSPLPESPSPFAAQSAAPLPPQAPPPPQARQAAPVSAQPRRDEPVRSTAQSEQRPGSTGQQQWPIYPMAGEPPLTLFRSKELRELPAGSELDRFGGPNGNLTYAAGTPFDERSLVPEWVNRPYHVYRVQRPLQALAGIAIPWFNQPGGGSAYLLPASIEKLVADGDLLELDPGEPPID